MTCYSIEPQTRKCVSQYVFYQLREKLKKHLLDTGLGALKAASKKVVHKAAEATGKCIGNKIEL